MSRQLRIRPLRPWAQGPMDQQHSEYQSHRRQTQAGPYQGRPVTNRQDQNRPDKVKLLLDSQRPEVQHLDARSRLGEGWIKVVSNIARVEKIGKMSHAPLQM